MKKILFTLLFGLIGLVSNAQQVYSKILYMDKFDDVIKTENIKTLISKTDSTFLFEEKGRKPIEYWIVNYAAYNSEGDKDNIVDLTGHNVYGYQDCWCVIKMSDKNAYDNDYVKVILEEEPIDILEKYWLFITHRVISMYSFEFYYDREYTWITNELNDNKLGNNVNRIVFSR